MNSIPDNPGERKLIPASRFSIEIRVSNSRFIASIAPAFTVAEAKAFIREINQLYPDASHNVPVYQIGTGQSVIAHSSDNGEPSGTAGRPALSVLAGSGLGDAVMVITRYFGGTKLGTGGLVKAYTESARAVIQAVPKAKKITVHHCQIAVRYSQYEQIERIIKKAGSKIDGEVFTDQVTLRFLVPAKSYTRLADQITEFTKGMVPVQIIAKDQTAILPIT